MDEVASTKQCAFSTSSRRIQTVIPTATSSKFGEACIVEIALKFLLNALAPHHTALVKILFSLGRGD